MHFLYLEMDEGSIKDL